MKDKHLRSIEKVHRRNIQGAKNAFSILPSIFQERVFSVDFLIAPPSTYVSGINMYKIGIWVDPHAPLGEPFI